MFYKLLNIVESLPLRGSVSLNSSPNLFGKNKTAALKKPNPLLGISYPIRQIT